MKKRGWSKSGFIFILSFSLLLFASFIARADEAKYIYDDLGRLYRVIDEQGNAATYHYDEVGNLLSITRGTGVAGPQITNISPNYAFGGDTVNVTITGTGLFGTSLSTNNSGITISNINVADTSITAVFSISYYANQGTALVTVKNALGSSSANFTVNPASPVITALQPSSGPITRFVSIVGTGFSPTLSQNQVKFNGVTAQIFSATPYAILTRVPAGATTGPVTVTTNGGTSNGVTFTVTSPAGPPPTITSIIPNIGSEDGGSIITINGTGFISGTIVYIGGNLVQGVGIISSTSLTVVTPAGTLGLANVLLSNDYGDVLVAGGFTYVEGPNQEIVAVNPTMGLINIPINTRVSALFTRPVDQTVVNTNSFRLVETASGNPVPGTFTFDFNGTWIGFTPASNLKPNTSYTLTIATNIKSQDGIPLDRPFSGVFTTTNSADTVSPTVSVTPANGARGVPINTLIVMNFSEPVSTTTINSSTITVTENGTPKSGFLSTGNQNEIVTFTPALSFLPNSSVDITLSQKITDTVGNRIVGSGGVGTDYVSSFTTTTTNDLVPPRVININPPDKSTGINVTTTISVTFSEPVNPLTVNSGTFTLSSGGTNLTGQIVFSGGYTVATFIPDQGLPQMTTITVTLAEGISDTAGNAMPLPFTSIFTTGMTIDNYQPSVIKVSPYNGQTGVVLSSEITIDFDERINAATINNSSFYVSCYANNTGGTQTMPGSISVSSDGLSATISPSQPLWPNATCYVYYTTGIKDMAGNVLYNPGNSTFYTGGTFTDTTPPKILGISPVNGATNLPVNTQILILFSENLDWTTVNTSTVSVSAGGVPVDTQLTYSGGIVRIQVANLNTFDPNTFYEVTVTTGVKDTAGNALAQEFVSGFTTGNITDTIPPDVATVLPANSATNITPNTSITVAFTEPIDPITVNSSTFILDYNNQDYRYGSYAISSDKKQVTYTPNYPLVAGHSYYIRLQNVEDLAGNKLPSKVYYFTTGYSPGTNVSTLPNQATVVINPNRLFADGISTATVQISNINLSGVLVPNGTKIAAGAPSGTILGGTASPDPRYRIFTTLGGAFTLTYQSPDIPSLSPGTSTTDSVQAYTVDSGNWLVNQIGSSSVTLFRGKSVSISPNPVSLLANGSSYSQVDVLVYDYYGNPVPPGMNIGVTAAPVYQSNSLGGTMQGGNVAIDTRFNIFTTITGGKISFTYTAPSLAASQSGTGYVQVVEVDDTGQVVGLLGSASVSLSGSTGYTAPQPSVVSVSPASGQSGVGLNVPIIAQFSQPLDPSTVNSTNFSITKGGYSVSGSLSLSSGIYGSNTIVTFVPAAPWVLNSSYTIYINTGIKSTSGNPLLQYSYTSFSTGTSADNQVPYIVGVNPPDGMTGVATNNIVTVQFSEPMAPSTINGSSFRVSNSSGAIAGRVSGSTTIFNFIPDALLLPNTQYTVTVDGSVTDIAGNHLVSAFSSTFVTEAVQDNYQPSVIQVSPFSYQTNVPLNSDITIVFDKRINPLSVNSSTFYLSCSLVYPSGVAGSISVSNDGLSATFTPSQPLLPNAQYYYINYTNGITDVAGNALYNPSTSYFTTGVALVDTTSPQVLAISPMDGASGVPVNADILIQFSKVVDQTTVNGNTLTVSTGGVPLAGNITFEQGGQVVRYVVANLNTFAPNTSYQVRVTTGVKDTAGNPLTQGFVSNFTTGSTGDTVPPDVASIVPANGATNVSPNTSVTVTFTEPIDPLTINGSTFVLDYNYQAYLYGTYTISNDKKQVTMTPYYPLFAGHGYYVRLQNIEDLAGNKLPSRAYYFTTAYTSGTDVNSFPTAATVVANPSRLFADGITTAIVQISNINRNGVLVPNGTKILVNASAGTILGGADSPDPRFRVFTTLGGQVTLTYQSPDLSSLTPGSVASGYIQVATEDAGDRPVSYINTSTYITLFRGKSVSISPNPVSLLANGSSYSQVDVLVYDYYGNPVPPGMNIGVTAAPVYQSSSLGGTIQGGNVAIDTRFKIFTTITGGKISFTYTAPSLASGQSGTGYIQVVEVDDTGQVVGLLGSASVTLSGSTGYTAPQPSVVSVNPANGQSGVGLNVPVVAQFSQSLDPSTINSTNFSITKGGTAVSGTLTLNDGVYGARTIVTFTPNNPWSPNTSYSIYIYTGIKSSSGNPLLQYSNTSFSTGTVLADTAPPFVVNVNPPDGSSSVGTNASISVQFSQYMSPTSINSASLHLSDTTGNINGKVAGSGTVFSFIPDGLLAPNTQHTLTIENTVSDIAGNHMASAFTSTFATQTGTDTYPPVITNVSPSNGTTGVPPTNPIVITFSKPMNPLTLNSASCYINDNSSNAVPSTIALSAGGTEVTITPIQPLFANISYSVNITTGVKDIAGNSLATALSSSFTTALAPGTGTLPTAAAITINPTTLFANGEIATTVTVSNINVNGTLVPNGTPIAVTAAPAYKPTSVGGTISGPSIGTSVDVRFTLFATEGASFTFFYTPPELDWLTPGATASGIIQVAAIDSSSRPSTLIVQGTATLYGLKTATVTPNPATLSANGASQSIVDVMVSDNAGNLAPDGTQIGITVAPVFVANSAGGTILGGAQSGADYRVKTFSTTGGHVTLTYQAPSSRGPGYAVIQAVTVNNQGAPTGLLGSATINLN